MKSEKKDGEKREREFEGKYKRVGKEGRRIGQEKNGKSKKKEEREKKM